MYRDVTGRHAFYKLTQGKLSVLYNPNGVITSADRNQSGQYNKRIRYRRKRKRDLSSQHWFWSCVHWLKTWQDIFRSTTKPKQLQNYDKKRFKTLYLSVTDSVFREEITCCTHSIETSLSML